MLKLADQRVEYVRLPWARGVLLLLAAGWVVGFVFGILAPPSAAPAWGRAVILIGCPVIAVWCLRFVGKCELTIDLFSGAYHMVDGFPFAEWRTSGNARSAFGSIVTRTSDMGFSVYLRPTNTKLRDFYIGQMSEVAAADLALRLGIPLSRTKWRRDRA
jgi:xanthosine utilization system XapX-like protein